MKKCKFDFSKLRGRMVEKGYTQQKLAEALGISLTAVSKKLGGSTYFSPDDVIKLSEVLEIHPTEIGAYFFTLSV